MVSSGIVRATARVVLTVGNATCEVVEFTSTVRHRWCPGTLNNARPEGCNVNAEDDAESSQHRPPRVR